MSSLFSLWTRCHMWVEFVGCLLHSEKFELAIICFLLLYPWKPLVQERMKSLFVLGSLTIHALACELWIWILWLVRVMLASVKHILIFKRERERETGCSFLESHILMSKCYIMHKIKFQKNLETVDILYVPLVGNSNIS